ncbi:hypothetical protein J5N97_012238 [Dioscorea zingiberensis]|uniref:Uncharacterized protein n=1 Tax=Dioscorea zingiberensis TaxID=325984 RepID=A0A9D5CPT7_9LILI|nr:hypothetical protein J5N97_012238 [Dioscorea zingiberensis]
MGDSTVMTIEFLRARLLSERSLSRTAKQRADQLAKKVFELEEQLRVVCIQRKKAEKAAAEVLAILESQRADGFSEVIDSTTSDGEEDSGGAHGKGDEKAKPSDEEVDGLSGPPVEGSASLQGRSLSWKSRSDSPNSCHRLRLKQFKQRQRGRSVVLLSSSESSPKYQLGMSCRRIKPKEMGSPAENEDDKSVLDAEEQSGSMWSNHFDDQLDKNGEASRDEIDQAIQYNENNEIVDGLCVNDHDGDEEMQRVLEQREQLIDQFQAQENAQREWEDKYNEKKSSILGICKLKNQPAIVETGSNLEQNTNISALKSDCGRGENLISSSGQPVAQTPNFAVSDDQKPHGVIREKNDSNHREVAPRHSDGCGLSELKAKPHQSTFIDHRNGQLSKQQHDMLVVREGTSTLEFAFPTEVSFDRHKTGKQEPGLFYDKSDSSSNSNQSLKPHTRGFIENPSSWSPSSDHSTHKFSRRGSSEIQRQLPQTSLNNLGVVLNALHHAKTSLRQQLDAYRSPSEGTLAIAAPTHSRIQAETMDIPIGSAGIFRLPTDSFPQDNLSRPKFYDSPLSLPSTRGDVRYALSTNGYHYRSSSYNEAEPRVSAGKQYFDPYLTSNAIYSSPNRYSLPYSALSTERSPFQNRVPRPYQETRNKMSRRDPHMYHGESSQFDTKRL